MILGLDTPSQDLVFIGDKVFAKISPDDILVVLKKHLKACSPQGA